VEFKNIRRRRSREAPYLSYARRSRTWGGLGEIRAGDEEVEEALAADHRENEALGREYGESKRIVGANGELPAGQVENKIAPSNYDEKVRAVAETKATIEALPPEDRRTERKAWVGVAFV
jgi:hypothetical protein